MLRKRAVRECLPAKREAPLGLGLLICDTDDGHRRKALREIKTCKALGPRRARGTENSARFSVRGSRLPGRSPAHSLRPRPTPARQSRPRREGGGQGPQVLAGPGGRDPSGAASGGRGGRGPQKPEGEGEIGAATRDAGDTRRERLAPPSSWKRLLRGSAKTEGAGLRASGPGAGGPRRETQLRTRGRWQASRESLSGEEAAGWPLPTPDPRGRAAERGRQGDPGPRALREGLRVAARRPPHAPAGASQARAPRPSGGRTGVVPRHHLARAPGRPAASRADPRPGLPAERARAAGGSAGSRRSAAPRLCSRPAPAPRAPAPRAPAHLLDGLLRDLPFASRPGGREGHRHGRARDRPEILAASAPAALGGPGRSFSAVAGGRGG